MRDDANRFSDEVKTRVTPRMCEAIRAGAQRECMTASEYVRRSIIEKLKADGVFATEAA